MNSNKPINAKFVNDLILVVMIMAAVVFAGMAAIGCLFMAAGILGEGLLYFCYGSVALLLSAIGFVCLVAVRELVNRP